MGPKIRRARILWAPVLLAAVGCAGGGQTIKNDVQQETTNIKAAAHGNTAPAQQTISQEFRTLDHRLLGH